MKYQKPHKPLDERDKLRQFRELDNAFAKALRDLDDPESQLAIPTGPPVRSLDALEQEEKQHALAWHYRNVETGLARLRCGELSSHLKHMLGDKGLEVLEGNAVVEIKPASINKGVIAHSLQRRLKPDFTLAIGDDRTDEDIFEALPEQAFTIKVGHGQTRAQYSLHDHEAVRSLLKALLEADT